MKLFISLILLIGVTSCKISATDLSQTRAVSAKAEYLDIFSKDSATINLEIKDLTIEDASLNDYMRDNMIGLSLQCDTIDGDIIHIGQKYREVPDSSCIKLIEYFESFEYVNCAKDSFGMRISDYFILLHLRPNKLVYSVYSD